MAKKSKVDRKPASAPQAVVDIDEQDTASVVISFVKSIVLTVSLSVASVATQLALRPLFGSTPAALNHSRIKLAATLLTLLISKDFPRSSEQAVLLGLATWLAYAPYSSYGIAVWSAKWKNPLMGASLTEALILVPTISLGIAVFRRWNSSSLPRLPGPLSVKTVAALGMFKLLDITETWLWSRLPLGGIVNASNIFLTAAGALMVTAILNVLQPSNTQGGDSNYLKRLLPLGLPIVAAAVALTLPPTASPSFPYSRAVTPMGSVTTSIRVLDRAFSNTGLILVGEHMQEEFRFMRADHSLLGGRWVGKKIAPGTNGLGDSIYSTFVLQEAVRLVRREYKPPSKQHALFIGLGVGIAAESFITRGINTTVVEIDPVVYRFAREYFNLPKPQHVYLQDARTWVQEHSTMAEDDKFDYVIHDCFSGGGVPQHIYTVEFWDSLKSILKEDGVLAVNFAGKVATEPTRAIYLTLQHIFGGCKAFHDHLDSEFDQSYDFFNIVVFCTPNPEITPVFREATAADFQGSRLRQHVLSGLPKRELDSKHLLGSDNDPKLLEEGTDKWILRDDYNPLGAWERADSVEHWTVMREVLPDIFWETY